jgi:hypothetical protein
VVRLGRQAENVGIVTLAARRLDPAGGDFELFVAVENFGSTARQGDLVILRDDSPIATRRLQLAPAEAGTAARQAFALPVGAGPARILARLDLERPDAMDADDRAALILPVPRPLRVAVVTAPGAEEPYLARALAADSWLQVQTDPRDADVVIALGGQPPSADGATQPPALIIPARAGPAADGTTVRGPRTAGWQRQHPVLRHLDPSPVHIGAATRLHRSAGSDVLWESTAGPLLAARQDRGRRTLQLAFHPLDSDLPLRVAYPVLVLSAVRWLARDESSLEGAVHRTGRATSVAVPRGTVRVEHTPPGGPPRLVTVPPQATEVGLGVLDRAGFHRLRFLGGSGGGGGAGEAAAAERWLAASLLDRTEGRIGPRPLAFAPAPPGADAIRAARTGAAASATTPGGPAGAAAGARGGVPYWRWVAALALLVLCAEWLAYRRGWVRA